MTKTATKTASAKPAKVAAEPKTFALADMARDLKMDPKIARAKARRTADIGKLRIKGEDHWVFSASKREAVSRLLQA